MNIQSIMRTRLSNVVYSALLCVSLFSIPDLCYAQKSKRVEVYKNNTYKDYVSINYFFDNKSNEVTSKLMTRYGKDLRYQGGEALVTIFYGKPSEVYKFLTELETFLDENGADFSDTIQDRFATVVKIMGMKGIWVNEKDGKGYRGYNLKTLNKIKEAISEWAKANNELLD
jgi:hypothetical protein